jgi:hypothetical protein
MGAATSVGYAARPLPLYYAISQASRAIAAAHADQPWKLKGHGLNTNRVVAYMADSIGRRNGLCLEGS